MAKGWAVLALLTAGCEAAAPAAEEAQQNQDMAGAQDGAAQDTALAPDTALTPDAAQTGTTDATAVQDQTQTADLAQDAAEDAAQDVAVAQDVAAPADVTQTEPLPKIYKTFIGDWTMKPKQEVTRCVVKRLDNPTEVWVRSLHTKLAKGSHHLIVYRSDATEEKPEPFDCDPFTETLAGGNVPLIISQVAEETLKLPPGVAFKFAKKQMIRIEVHYLNYFKEDIVAHADIDFDTVPKSMVQDEADLMFYGTPDLWLPKGKETQTPWFYLPVPEGAKVFALTGHTHALGTNVEIGLAAGATVTAPTLVYPPADDPYDWAEPPMAKFMPPLPFKAGQGLQYRCTWNNTTDKGVGFGESAKQEMCFFWAYYYPSQGYRMCVNPGKYKDQSPIELGNEVCCPDSALCDLIKLYLKNLGG